MIIIFLQIESNKNKEFWFQGQTLPYQWGIIKLLYWLRATHLLFITPVIWRLHQLSRPGSLSPKQTVERVGKMICALAFSVQQALVHFELSDLLQSQGTPHLLPARVIQISSRYHTLLLTPPMNHCSQVSNICFWLLGLETCPDSIFRTLFASGISQLPHPTFFQL